MATVQRNIRLTELEDSSLVKRAEAYGMPLTDYIRMKIAEPDLAPQIEGMVKQLSRMVGMACFEVVERILADHFAYLSAVTAVHGEAAQAYLGQMFFAKFNKIEVNGEQRPKPVKDVYDMLLQNYTRQEQEQQNKDFRQTEELGKRIAQAEEAERLKSEATRTEDAKPFADLEAMKFEREAPKKLPSKKSATGKRK